MAPLGNDLISPLGVKTKISLAYKFILKSSTKSTALVSELSKAYGKKGSQGEKKRAAVATGGEGEGEEEQGEEREERRERRK